MYMDYVIEKAPFVVDEDQIDKIFPKEYTNKYIIVLILSLVTAAFFGLSLLTNKEIVVAEERKGHPSPLVFFFLQLVFSILLSFIVYFSYKKVFAECVRPPRKNLLKWAFLIYIVVYVLWCAVLFHSKISSGLSGILSVIMMICALWLCVCAFNYDKWTIIPSLFFLGWNAYLLYFTYDSSVNVYKDKY